MTAADDDEAVKTAPEETLSSIVISPADSVDHRQAQTAGGHQPAASPSGHQISSNEASLSSEFEIISRNEI